MHEELAAALASRYEIERELGRGGMAVVYLARDVKHGREVAIKVLLPELGNTIGFERFLREIATAARLTHPNILPLHDSGEAAGLLYYVMPYVRGETLRHRITRERQLPLDEAVMYAKQIAAALDHAHEQGVVHRDIKPENILIGGGQAIVADFGLARALYSAASQPLTRSGLAVGTPAYMSPEQASAERTIDARTDIYSLGCVVFEMISGMPPFRGATAQALIAHHIATPPPSLCIDRATCPTAIDLAVRRALAKAPADRFRTAGEFIRAMDVGTPLSTPIVMPSGAPARQRLRVRVIAGAVGVLALAGIAAATIAALGGAAAPDLDRSKVMVLPSIATPAGDSATATAIRQQIVRALTEWDGLEVIDDPRMRSALGDRADAPAVDDGVKAAHAIGAGLLVRAALERSGDSIVVVATAYDAHEGRVIRARELTYPASTLPTREQLRPLANAMIRARDELPPVPGTGVSRPKLAAWLAYDSGRVALDAWDLVAARTQLREAVGLDPEHARAQLWLAQVLTWEGDSTARGDRRQAARQATELGGRLVPHDVAVATGLLALSESRYPDACAAFERAVDSEPRSFPAQYGLGDCQTRDSVVVPDVRSPSKFAFRSSHHAGITAYVRALDALPATRPDFPYRRLGTVVQTEMNRFRSGYRIAGDTLRYFAIPTLSADTLAFVPYPLDAWARTIATSAARAHPRALERNRQLLRDLFAQWVRASPRSAVAREELARLLEITGEIAPTTADAPSALSEVRAARQLTADPTRQLELARDEVRLLVKNEEFARAAQLADSLLTRYPSPTLPQADPLLGLAALAGKVERTAQLMRQLSGTTQAPDWGDGKSFAIAPALGQRLAGARASALFGICSDSVRTLRDWIDRSLVSHYADSVERNRVRDAVIWRSLSQATPCLGPSAVVGVSANDALLGLQQTLATRGPTEVRAGLERLRMLRTDLRPGDVAIDYTYHEAWLLTQAGDTAAAIDHLDRTLGALSTLGTFLLAEPSQAAGFVRAAILRAQLAHGRQDPATAKRWATVALALWGKGDAILEPALSELRTLAGGE